MADDDIVEEELAQRRRDAERARLNADAKRLFDKTPDRPITDQAKVGEGKEPNASHATETIEQRHKRLQREAREGNPALVGSGIPRLDALSPKARKIITDCANTGEPIIVFRGRDIFTPMVLAYYMTLIDSILPGNLDQQEGLVTLRNDLVEWQRSNTDKIRYPD